MGQSNTPTIANSNENHKRKAEEKKILAFSDNISHEERKME